MKIYKFGGASVKDATGIKNLAEIISDAGSGLIIVVSAFGKTTNALEILLKTWFSGNKVWKDHLEAVRLYHLNVIEGLFPGAEAEQHMIDGSFASLRSFLENDTPLSYDLSYDQVVSYGELWSTMIIARYLDNCGIRTKWTDVRNFIITDERFRDANVIWDISAERIKKEFSFSDTGIYVTQGFIGSSLRGKTTTLGREGSDYTAAIFANLLDAESVTVWKDVPGLLNADPKWMPDARKMDEVSYREAVEMTFSGAKVIHPKTIKPLQNKNIPLYVKSFLAPENEGTLVTSEPELKKIIPVFIRKENQLLVTLLPKDFSFVMGDNLSRIFYLFMNQGIKVNLVEASAVSIDVCIDDDRAKVESLLNSLKNDYSVFYNENVEMLTVRHYDDPSVKRISDRREILLEQRTRSTVRFVVKSA